MTPRDADRPIGGALAGEPTDALTGAPRSLHPDPFEALAGAADPAPAAAARAADGPQAAPAPGWDADFEIGALADRVPDTMILHTRDAYALFNGRLANPLHGREAIAGARRFGDMLKALWNLSAHDNPYADWILIRAYDRLRAIRAEIRRETAAREDAIEALARIGLTFGVMASRRPKAVELGFRSPYGYATAEAMVEFDYHVRVVKTLVLKDRLSDKAGRDAIYAASRPLRSLFLAPIPWLKALFDDELRPLTRADFLPGADPAARRRARAAVARFGEVPRDVFTGTNAPRHTRRRVNLSAAELRLLATASLAVGDDRDESAGDSDLL